uniref:Zinc finger protein 665 n=3 Tax=Zeugodacus cucurbitae TaxID=28588 RepID=A0A0A1XK82_ZEUCU
MTTAPQLNDSTASSMAAASTTVATATPQPASTGTKSMLVQLTTDGVPKLHCPVCDKALVSLSGYVKHVKKHEPPGGFLCRYCDDRFCSEEELKKHRDNVHTTIVCRLCTAVTFTNESDYREHIRVIHNGIDREMLKCDKCGAEYKTIYPFKRHIETECGKIKPHKCEQCAMTFVTKYNLKQHMVLHTGERKYCCSYCGKNFLQKGRLVEHERSHTGEKPHKCDVCGKCFAHRESIVTHSSIHTGVRLVECKCCLTRFSCHSNLIKHRRTRPDTCGLPEFDPPKQRMRTHRHRIPPTLNPTSEIKVNNSNRIIKPDHKELVRRSIAKLDVEAAATNLPAKKRVGGRPGKRKRKVSSTDTEEDDETEQDMWHPESSEKVEVNALETAEALETGEATSNTPPLGLQNGTENESIKQVGKFETDSEEDEYVDFDAAVESGSGEDEHKENVQLTLAKLKDIKEESSTRSDNYTDNTYEDDELEFIDSREFVGTEFEVKSEDANIFKNKDKILDTLLKDKTTPSGMKREQAGLHETELILIKAENSVNYVEETDILDVDGPLTAPLASCKIMLRDVCQRYPTLKEEASVKVSRNAIAYPRPRRQQSNADAYNEIDADGKDDDLAASKKLRKNNKKVEHPQVDGNEAKTAKRGRKPRQLTENVPFTDDDEEQNKPTTDKNKPRRMAKLSQKELKARLKLSKRGEKPWQCPYCIKVYHIRKPFEKHLRDDHQRPEEEIKETFKPEETTINDGEVFKCHICAKIYLMEKRLSNHIQMHGPDGSLIFKCPCYCSIYFATKDEATAHARKEHRDLIFCNICEKFMTGHDSLKNHMRKHEQEKDNKAVANRNFVCDKCGKKFSGRTSLTDHVRSDCGRKPLYQCTVCGKHLTTAGILKTHLLLHKDDTPYQCDKCGKTFKVKAQYKTHIKTRHTDYKPFQCHLCPKAYPYRESLLTHMTVHTGIKRFLCNGCGKRFTCVSNLQAHRKVHSDTCGQLPLNAKATQYMGVQKGNLLLGAKPEAGVDYKETNTLIAKEVIDRDRPMAQEINYPSEPSAPLATVPLNYTQTATPQLLLPQVITQFMDDTHTLASTSNAYG